MSRLRAEQRGVVEGKTWVPCEPRKKVKKVQKLSSFRLLSLCLDEGMTLKCVGVQVWNERIKRSFVLSVNKRRYLYQSKSYADIESEEEKLQHDYNARTARNPCFACRQKDPVHDF